MISSPKSTPRSQDTVQELFGVEQYLMEKQDKISTQAGYQV